MVNHNITDNEIIKALECCRKPIIDCECCPVEYGEMCFDHLKTLALDLINRQKVEIEQYENKLVEIHEGIKEVITLYPKDIAKAKAEAIKEFVKRLKVESFLPLGCWISERIVTEKRIDDLVKEMVGDSNAMD